MRIVWKGWEGAGRATLAALAVRALAGCFSEDRWGDAPARFELVERWVASPGLHWDFGFVAQFGPLPTHLAGALSLAVGAELATRLVTIVAGVLAVPLAWLLAARFGGARAGAFAAWALALSPLHVQASTTWASEAIYVAFALGAVLRAFAGDPWGLAACAFGAATTRFDTWLWLPLVGAWWLLRAPVDGRWKRAAGFVLLGLGPASILAANALAIGDPLRPLSYVSAEHVLLATHAQARWGGALWRASMAGFWPLAIVVVLTPAFGIALAFGLFRALRDRAAALAPAAMGATPPILYAARSILLGTFWPMTRFAIGPAALLLAAAPAISRRALAACIAIAIAFDVALVAASEWDPGLNPLSPVARLDHDVRAGVDAVRSAPGPVLLDLSPTYEEIEIARHVPLDRWHATHPPEGTRPGFIVTFDGGALDRRLRDGGLHDGRAWRMAGERGRVRWWLPRP